MKTLGHMTEWTTVLLIKENYKGEDPNLNPTPNSVN